MNELVTFGNQTFFIGAIAGLLILIISGWELRHGDKKLSRKKFVRTTWLIGISTAISGVGLVPMLASSLQPDNFIIRIFLYALGCIGIIIIYPAIMMGVYVLNIKSGGYVETDELKD